MSTIKYNDEYSYEIFDDGYDIFLNDKKIITQHEPFGKPCDVNKSYEENAIMQIEEIINDEKQRKHNEMLSEINQANIDYLALMLDVELPNQEEEPVTEEEGE